MKTKILFNDDIIIYFIVYREKLILSLFHNNNSVRKKNIFSFNKKYIRKTNSKENISKATGRKNYY